GQVSIRNPRSRLDRRRHASGDHVIKERLHAVYVVGLQSHRTDSSTFGGRGSSLLSDDQRWHGESDAFVEFARHAHRLILCEYECKVGAIQQLESAGTRKYAVDSHQGGQTCRGDFPLEFFAMTGLHQARNVQAEFGSGVWAT